MPYLFCTPRLLALPAALALCYPAFAQTGETTEATLPEVIVSSDEPADGIATEASIGTFSSAPLRETPVSVKVITRTQMQERSIRNASEAAKYDASVQDSYNAIGLSDRLAIRGFELSTGASYRKDGLLVLAQAPIMLENKEQLEVLKGLGGLQAGIASSGGVLNYVTKRPTDYDLRSVTLEASERGTLYGAVDLGGRFGENREFGYRINAMASEVRSYAKGSNGERRFFSGAFDWQISPDSLLQLDFDYLHKSQLSVPGFQLLGGTVVPKGVSARDMLNNQPWSSPVVDDVTNLGLRFQHKINDNWRTEISANYFELRRDDAVALPISFQSNGDYTVVDLRRDNDKRTVLAGQALLQGDIRLGSMRHEVTFGAAAHERRDHFARYVFSSRGTSNIYDPVDVTPSPDPNFPVHLRRQDNEYAVFVQDVMHLNDQFKLHAGLRHVRLDRDQYNDDGSPLSKQDFSFLLPNVALVFSPDQRWSYYGAYSEGLEPGGEAPAGTSNVGEALDPSKSRQIEFGLKGALTQRLNVSAAVFQIKRQYEYTSAANVYTNSGTDRRRGIELSADGRVTPNLLIGASVTRMLADVDGVSGKRVGNVPKYKSVVYGEYTLPSMPQMRLNGSWVYSSSKLFAPSGNERAKLAGYHVFNLGAQYLTEVNGVTTTIRFGVHNVFDKFYWGDTSSTFGGYLIPGAPRTFRLSAQFDF
ncbi:MAG: TonB-dependent siderophore receptor [Pseudazoarcus pumilus]|nr:TonB-dependent siderophore receptor [Pseudazoarcus pumilus]